METTRAQPVFDKLVAIWVSPEVPEHIPFPTKFKQVKVEATEEESTAAGLAQPVAPEVEGPSTSGYRAADVGRPETEWGCNIRVRAGGR